MAMNPPALDGNATAGALDDVFAFDATVAVTTCATCRRTHRMAELRAYLDCPGTVLRSASCGAVQVRVVRSRSRAWLDLTGVRLIELPMR
jgi:hypothetical protein